MENATGRLVLAGGLLVLIGMLAVWGVWSSVPPVAQAQESTIRYVATTGTDTGDCTDLVYPCATVQYAVDQAITGDGVCVATGVYTDIHQRAGVTQTVYISKTVVIRGGYPADFNGPPDPEAQPTTLDAQGQGRVLYIVGPISPTVEGLHITGGDATGLGGALEPFYGDAGGGIYTLVATTTLRSNYIFSNTASLGGGVCLNRSHAILSGNTIAAHTANAGGGLRLSYSTAILNGNSITANTAELGGGVDLFASGITLNKNTISANVAGQHGGGLWLADSTAVFSENMITTNTATLCGGGLSLDRSYAVLGNNILTANTAEDGGGLDTYRSSVVLDKNTFGANVAYHRGGGVYLCRTGAMLSRNSIIANTASRGGGLFATGSGATLTNDTVADNQAHTAGSGLYVEQSSLYLCHTTIARNHDGDGSGIHVTRFYSRDYSTVALTNTILVSHTVGISVTAGNTVTLEATLWGAGAWANGVDWGGAGVITSTRNTWGAPAFANPAAGDYHIGPGSAAINAGGNTEVTIDMDGDARPDWCFPDLGADEFITGRGCTRFYLPLAFRSHVL